MLKAKAKINLNIHKKSTHQRMKRKRFERALYLADLSYYSAK